MTGPLEVEHPEWGPGFGEGSAGEAQGPEHTQKWGTTLSPEEGPQAQLPHTGQWRAGGRGPLQEVHGVRAVTSGKGAGDLQRVFILVFILCSCEVTGFVLCTSNVYIFKKFIQNEN